MSGFIPVDRQTTLIQLIYARRSLRRMSEGNLNSWNSGLQRFASAARALARVGVPIQAVALVAWNGRPPAESAGPSAARLQGNGPAEATPAAYVAAVTLLAPPLSTWKGRRRDTCCT
jgi:hypothetical protein